ncbi:hypothetical protein [Streptomyces sp. NBC_01233]|uniref:hypothetical protein n=1 Tax=Streptomyces sp. NBC_01233 TaxID=2903787 RepID=UPI003FA35141
MPNAAPRSSTLSPRSSKRAHEPDFRVPRPRRSNLARRLLKSCRSSTRRPGWPEIHEGLPEGFYPFDRASRGQGVEVALLLSTAQKSDWRDCTDSSDTCRRTRAGPAVGSRTTRPVQRCAGPSACFRSAPYAWRDLVTTSHTTERVMILEVTC